MKMKLWFEVLHDTPKRLTVRYSNRIGALLDLDYRSDAARPWRVRTGGTFYGAYASREAAEVRFYEVLGMLTLDKARSVMRAKEAA